MRLQLLWYHQFQSAGYYAAKAQGYYRQAGLDVEIRHGGYDDQGQAPSPLAEVLSGRADFGIARSELLMHHARGAPVVVLANLMQRSPLVLMTLARHDFTKLEEIGERPISVTLPGTGNRTSAETLATFLNSGLAPATLNNSPPRWELEALLTGETQLMPAYLTDAPYRVRQRGATPVLIRPTDHGIDFYGDLLFTRQALLEAHPDRVAAFRRASLKGWAYALENVDEVIELILREYPERNTGVTRGLLRYEAEQIRRLMQPDLIQIGHINPQRWRDIGEIYTRLNLIDDVDLDGFLYRADTPSLAALILRWWRWLLPIGVMGVLVSALATYLWIINARLRHEIRRRQEAERSLQRLADRDGLTGADNRRFFETTLARTFAQARRHHRPLTLMMLDVDHFKQINDRHGHLAGDQVLVGLVEATRGVIRQDDHLARYGGEEFAVIMPDTSLDAARVVAERVLDANRRHAVATLDGQVHYTVSIGLASLTADDGDPLALIQRADDRLYLAKRGGRDRLAAPAGETPAPDVGQRPGIAGG
ncbi:diguanylate cyclase [Halomonas koreensis]|uniref:diguanylate cyclase n=1 Tax=Halomonas koreensis TaxID=245385 RepID=A0ABU1FZI4_9GAMM|nr:diguanylate cyclase [Halomonas koreensis]MDR5866099.1 diguanylate cyclase [Halomonas koreensis]